MGNELKSYKIRFGIMCTGLQFPVWQANAVNKLLELDRVECGLLIISKKPPVQKKNILIKAFSKITSRNFLWMGYQFLTHNKFRSWKITDLGSVLQGIAGLECETIKKGTFSEYFKDENVLKIREYKLDFILRFGFSIIRGDILNSAKYGVWSFHHDDEQKYRGSPPCLWEIYKNDNITGAILQRLTDKLDAGIVLKKGYLKTNPSYIKNRDAMYFESARWPAQVCKDIINGNTGCFDNEPSRTNAPIYVAPTNLQFVRFIISSAYKRFKNRFIDLFYVDYWNIGVAHAPIHAFLNQDNPPHIHWFPNLPKTKFIADPFGFFYKHKLHILCEEYPYHQKKGKIVYLNYNNRDFSLPQDAVTEPFHMSYPYIFRHNDETYFIPETWQAHKIIIYQAVEFPSKWEQHHIMIDNFDGVDNTLFKHNNTWWLFSTDHDSIHNLMLFYSDDIFGNWQAHPQNPVKTDIRSARSAGTPFVHEEALYRPAIDYSEKLEGGIIINKVTELSRTGFKEEKYCAINPYKNSKFPDKIHTLSAAGEYTIIDGCKEASIFTNFSPLKFKLSDYYARCRKKIIRWSAG